MNTLRKRRSLRIGLMLILSTSILLPTSLGWSWKTHIWIGNELCDYLECGDCREHMINGSIAPDKEFRDTINHHCYDLAWDCPEGKYWDCPIKDDCPALEKAEEWILKSRSDFGCTKYYDIGVASHYFSDSKVFWHKVQKENYDNCHKPFETKVGNQIEKDFEVTECGITVTKQDLVFLLDSFKSKLSSSGYEGTEKQENMFDFFLEEDSVYIIGLIVVLFSLIAVLIKKRK